MDKIQLTSNNFSEINELFNGHVTWKSDSMYWDEKDNPPKTLEAFIDGKTYSLGDWIPVNDWMPNENVQYSDHTSSCDNAKYKIVRNNNPEILEAMVNGLMSDGWVTNGNLVFDDGFYCQPMVKGNNLIVED